MSEAGFKRKVSQLVDDVCYIMDIDLSRDIKDLTEEEARQVLDILTKDGDDDFKCPMGDACK